MYDGKDARKNYGERGRVEGVNSHRNLRRSGATRPDFLDEVEHEGGGEAEQNPAIQCFQCSH